MAVVTGGAHGIGNCIKEEFENYGATVYVIDKAEGNHFIGDLSSKEVIEEFCHDVIKKSGRIDYLINNALPLMKGIDDCTYEEFQDDISWRPWMEPADLDDMSIFEFFQKLNHPFEKEGWIETTAVFTGKAEKAAVGKPGHYKVAAYNEYEIIYRTNDEERRGWYTFNPLPDSDDIKGTSIRIRYNSKKPWIFERVKD